MQVLVEPTPSGVRIRSGSPLDIITEGVTEEDAMFRLKDALAERMQNGVHLVDFAWPQYATDADHPWKRLAGIFKDDPTFDEWEEAIRENRHLKNAEEGPW